MFFPTHLYFDHQIVCVGDSKEDHLENKYISSLGLTRLYSKIS